LLDLWEANNVGDEERSMSCFIRSFVLIFFVTSLGMPTVPCVLNYVCLYGWSFDEVSITSSPSLPRRLKD
jgi:hypothetical protein